MDLELISISISSNEFIIMQGLTLPSISFCLYEVRSHGKSTSVCQNDEMAEFISQQNYIVVLFYFAKNCLRAFWF
jgi:hypothetical protein